MTRELIIERWDTMSPRERDAWVARTVMGWRRKSWAGGGGGAIGWVDADGRMTALESDCSLSSGPDDWFRPSVNIAVTMRSVMPVLRENWLVNMHDSGSFGWRINLLSDSEDRPDIGDIVAQKLSEAICLAALIAKLTEVPSV